MAAIKIWPIIVASMNDKLVFQETQYSSGGYILAIILSVLFIAAIVFLLRIKNTWSGIVTGLIVLVGLFMISIATTLRLKTFYYNNRIDYQFVSILSAPYEQISMDTVIWAGVVTYDPQDYGGWGTKHSDKGSALAYSTDGNKGLLLRFKNGKKLLLGTHKPDSLDVLARQYYHH